MNIYENPLNDFPRYLGNCLVIIIMDSDLFYNAINTIIINFTLDITNNLNKCHKDNGFNEVSNT